MQDDVLRRYTNPKGWTLLLVVLTSEEGYEIRIYHPIMHTCLKQAFSLSSRNREEAFTAARKLADTIQDGQIYTGLVIPRHGHPG